ncbi:hypothetical protein [Halobacillus campisalis]|uniref:Uncharacterized protein n=1 Tax=Halobacillus campisalis TaxID=435909 RepID=A0ABW2K7B4_9BACI|nr:hypothetical protein [Halobacillus campisalis]
MNQPLIVTQPFSHVQNAAYEELKKTIHFHKFEKINLTDPPHYIDPMGWYIPLANDRCAFHLSSDTLDEYYRKGFITTYDDLVLERNYLQYKINQSLDDNAKEQFELFADKLNKVNHLIDSFTKSKNPIAL